MQPMSTAPRDKDILVLGPKGWRRVWFWDCQWLREPFLGMPGDPSVSDCWHGPHGDDIELNEARGWKPAPDR